MSDLATGILAGKRAGRKQAEGELRALLEENERLQHENLSLQEQNRQSRASAAGHQNVRMKLTQALRQVAPDHPLANPSWPEERNPAQAEAFNEASQREWDRNTPASPKP